MIKEYLIHCYLYYVLNESIISDVEFDKLCRKILEEWETLQSPYKNLLTPDAIEAGTGYNITDYPTEIKRAAEKLLAARPKPVAEYKPCPSLERTKLDIKEMSDYFVVALFQDWCLAGVYLNKPSARIDQMKQLLKEEILCRNLTLPSYAYPVAQHELYGEPTPQE